MEQCPACGAKSRQRRTCHRCKSNLGPLLDIEADARKCLESAESAHGAGNHEDAYRQARRACTLLRTPDAVRLLVRAAAATGRYPVALGQWAVGRGARRTPRGGGTAPAP